jgi:transcriptional regulator with XRE-family HTH domain
MEDIALGRVFRQVRVRRGWRQVDVADRAHVSRSTYSETERGHLDACSLSTLRRVAAVLEVRLTLEASWRGGDLGRLLSSRHSAMANAVAGRLVAAGWLVRPEVSFNHFGERGVMDLCAFHPITRTLLIVEIKTELVDVGALLATADRRARLADVIGRSGGWEPARVASWIVVADGRTNRRVVSAHRELIRAAFPGDGRAIEGWIRDPGGAARALWFLPDSSFADTGQTRRPVKRVRRPRSRPG